jgi:hypothetical protein
MFKMFTLMGLIITGNVFCAATEVSDSSLEEDDARQGLTTSQISAATPATKLQYFKIFWEIARATYDAYNIEDAAEVAAEVSNQNKLLREKFEEMHLTLGDTFSLTLQSMNTQLESVSAYKYYKNAYNAEKKLLKAKLNEES